MERKQTEPVRPLALGDISVTTPDPLLDTPGELTERIQRAFRILFLLALGPIQPVGALHAHHSRNLPTRYRMLASLPRKQARAA